MPQQVVQHIARPVGARGLDQGLQALSLIHILPDFWQFPTGSMGIGPINAIYQARFMRYLEHRSLVPGGDRKVWGIFGDGEMDEPESIAALTLAAVSYTHLNDMRFALPQGYSHADPFFQYLKDSFDALYAEGDEAPKMLSIGMHCRLLGRPGRIVALQRFLDHIARHDRVWVCRRLDIARH